MPPRQPTLRQHRPPRRSEFAERPPLSPEHLAQRSLALPHGEQLLQIAVRSPTRHPLLFRNRLGTYDRRARHGDLVQLALGDGQILGYGLFNPRSEITVRVLTHSSEPPREEWWMERIGQAAALRRDVLKLDQVTGAYRVVHAEGDGLSGLAVDRFGDVLSIEVFSLAMYQRIDALAPLLAQQCGTKHVVIRCGPQTLEQEGFTAEPFGSPRLASHVTIEEFGTRFRIDLRDGHKTGFFCDQRDNRRKLAELCAGKTVLDACCYTGGFALQAKVLGGAAEVTGVDLDEQAIVVARENAKLNRAQVRFIHADAFAYLRDMLRNQRRYDVVVLDPPKLIRTRDELELGQKKYYDLNRLAMQLVAPQGWLLTCTCSGLMGAKEFQQTVASALPGARSAQILYRTGAAADHPIATHCPETEYLQALWLRLEN